jgi:hypothetical protein
VEFAGQKIFFLLEAGTQTALPMFIFSRTVSYGKSDTVFASFFSFFKTYFVGAARKPGFGLRMKWFLVQCKLSEN